MRKVQDRMNSNIRLALKILGIVFVLCSLPMLALLVWLYVSTSAFLDAAVPAVGTVTGFESGAEVHFPIVAYETHDGQDVEVRMPFGSDPPRFVKGEKVDILYAPEDPQRVELNEWLSLWFGVIVSGFLFVIPFGLGIAAILLSILMRKFDPRATKANGNTATA